MYTYNSWDKNTVIRRYFSGLTLGTFVCLHIGNDYDGGMVNWFWCSFVELNFWSEKVEDEIILYLLVLKIMNVFNFSRNCL